MQNTRVASPSLRVRLSSLCHLHRLHPLLFLFLFLFIISFSSDGIGVAAQTKRPRTYPLLGAIPATDFSCAGRPAGYYADTQTGCQVYHMCDTLEKQYSYLCPNHTLFNQKFMVCDHWYMVNCSSATTFYDLNNHIGEVPERTESSGADANVIQNKDSGAKDSPDQKPKSSPVAVVFKAPGTTSTRLPIPNVATSAIPPSRGQNVAASSVSSPLSPPASTPPTSSFTTKRPRPLSTTKIAKDPPLPTKLDSRVDIPFVQVSTTENPFKMVPGVVARRPVNRFSFTSGDKENSHDIPIIFQDIVFRPLVIRPKFPVRNVSTDMPPPSVMEPILRNAIAQQQGIDLPNPPAFLIPPKPIESAGFKGLPTANEDSAARVNLPPAERRTEATLLTQRIGASIATPRLGEPALSLPVPSTILEPPVVSPLRPMLEPLSPTRSERLQPLFPAIRMKQESPTPLSTRRGLLRPLFAPQFEVPAGSTVAHMNFTSSRGNRDFFIPSDGLTLPTEDLPILSQNGLGDPHDHHINDPDHHHDHHDHHDHMTMVFPVNPEEEFASLKLNPNCPRCHPAFLKPGECTPCVLIR